jgi:hypothetical protein
MGGARRMSYYRAIRSRAPQPIAIAAAVALVAGPGCASPSPSEDAGARDVAAPAAPRASKLIGQPAPTESNRTVELIDPGREPRRRLRYSAGAGTRQRVHLRASLASETRLAGRRAAGTPPQLTEAWFDVSVVAAQADRLECEVRFERADAIDWEMFAADRVGAAVTLDRLPGHAFRFTMDRRGFVTLPPLRLPPALDVDRDRDLVWDVLERSVRAIVALPEEPIGAGARWRTVEEDRGQFNMPARASADVELVAVRGQRLELKLAQTYIVPPQGAFVGIQLMAISRTQSSGSGRAVLDLSLLHPIEERARMELGQEGALVVLSEQLPMRTLLTGTLSITAK